MTIRGPVDTAPDVGDKDATYPPLGVAASVIIMLMIISLFAQLDRQIPNFLVDPIRRSMDISDTQMSLIQGSSFALMYSLMGLPFGWYVDRANRRNIIAFGLLVWSVATVYCGYASSFWHLFAGRMMVGLGEAALAPAVYSLIADYVKPSIRGRALSLYFLSVTLGSGLAIMVIGWFVDLSSRLQGVSALAGLEPWQIAFVLAGVPGLVLLPLLFLIREVPRRTHAGKLVNEGHSSATVGQFVKYLKGERRVFISVYGSLGLLQFCNMATYAWAPTHFIRKFGISPAELGLWLGLTISIVAVTGSQIRAAIIDRVARSKLKGGRLLIAPVCCAITAPLHFLWPLAPTPALGILCLGLAGIATATASTSSPAIVQDVFPNRMRGKGMAVNLLLSGILGYALAPTVVALVTDYVYGDDKNLALSLVTVVPPMALAAAALGLAGLGAYSALQRRLQDSDI